MSKKLFRKGILALAVSSVMGLSTHALADVVIGVAGPHTGANASFGEQYWRGASQAAEDINAAGGINGEKIKLVKADDACEPKQAVAVANRLVDQDKAIAVVGHFCSSSTIPHPRSTTRPGSSPSPRFHQPAGHRARTLRDVSHVRPRRPAGRGRRRLYRQGAEGQEGRGDPRQGHLWPGPGGRHQGATEQARRERGSLRGPDPRRGTSTRWLPRSAPPVPRSSTSAACIRKPVRWYGRCVNRD